MALDFAEVTGWQSWPVTVLRGTASLVGYQRLAITGRSPRMWFGFHDDHVREIKFPGGWVPHQACSDPAVDGWDGSDIYRPAETLHCVLTEKAADALRATGLGVGELTEVGRMAMMLVDEETEWRRRTGVQPGQRPGTPTCPTLLDRVSSPPRVGGRVEYEEERRSLSRP